MYHWCGCQGNLQYSNWIKVTGLSSVGWKNITLWTDRKKSNLKCVDFKPKYIPHFTNVMSVKYSYDNKFKFAPITYEICWE